MQPNSPPKCPPILVKKDGNIYNTLLAKYGLVLASNLASFGVGAGFSQALIPLGVTRGFLGGFGDNLIGIKEYRRRYTNVKTSWYYASEHLKVTLEILVKNVSYPRLLGTLFAILTG